MSDFITASNAAKIFNVTTTTIALWIAQGKLPGARKINPDKKSFRL